MNLGNLVLKQKIMRRVLLSLIPLIIFSVFLFGWRMLVLLAFVCLIGILCEYAAMRLINGKGAKVSEAVLVSCFLFTLTLPPATPLWVAGVGIAFGVFFGKGVFGGFGRNIFNPALVGRCLVYVSFPTYLTANWSAPFTALPGGFAQFGTLDALAMATPMALMKDAGTMTGYGKLFLGTIAGSAGETSALLILCAAIYLLVTKTASWRIMLSCALSFAVLGLVLFLLGETQADPLFSLLSGGFLFGTVFMTTDPVSAPADRTAQLIYGVLIAAATVLIRTYSLFTEGMMFAILFANTFSPLLERQIKELKARKKVAA